MKHFVVLFLSALCFAQAAQTSSLNATVEKLLTAVEKSDCKFVRNGSEHNGKDASAHMRRKYEHFKKDIKTPEDFIEKCASKSELSGKPYSVKLPDGKTIRCDEWLKKTLLEIQKTP
jgi:hypothetical protein